MFGIGLPEMLMIGLVALVVLGPDRLPEAARSFGKAISDIRKVSEPARAAWQELTTEVNSVVSGTGNPWTVHPILAKMTPEERESYLQGGEMPAHVALELDQIAANGPRAGQTELEGPVIDYPMPHSTNGRTAQPTTSEPEALDYPAPTGATDNKPEETNS